ncbi:MAG: hypothetical protein EA349_15840 [Halomonadaceae bacterium]|nr:MAG: hypothetical protein EA349_15840 [Halomonadaceae bacterium]
MRSGAKLSPKTRKIPDLDNRIEKIRLYEQRGKPKKLDFEEIVGPTVWAAHWDNWETIQNLLKEAQILAKEINHSVAEACQNEP